MPRDISPLCVYCGTATGARPDYVNAAHELGRLMAAQNIAMVYGGGRVGLMGVIADAAISGGGQVTGIITEALKSRELGHLGISELRVVDTMHERKKAMADLARAFIALPGGVGTLDEVFEMLCWAQLGIHEHPIGLLNTAGYYDRLLAFLDHVATEGFLRLDPRRALVVASDPAALLEGLRAWTGHARSTKL